MVVKKLKAKVIRERDCYVIDIYYDRDPQYKLPVFSYHADNLLQLHEDCASEFEKHLDINIDDVISTFWLLDINPFRCRKQYSHGSESYDIIVSRYEDIEVVLNRVKNWWKKGLKKIARIQKLISDGTICGEVII